MSQIPTYLLLGKTGVGKSSFVNAVFGIQLAKTDRFSACTKLVEYYAQNTPYGEICLIDTPGLGEGGSIESTDLKYFDLVRTQVDFTRLPAVIYLHRFDDPRFRRDESEGIKLLTKRIGPQVWTRKWLILTFAASVAEEERSVQGTAKVDAIGKAIREGLREVSGAELPFMFQQVLWTDNIVIGWSKSGRPTAEFLAK